MNNYLVFAGYTQFHHDENKCGAYDIYSTEETKEKAITKGGALDLYSTEETKEKAIATSLRLMEQSDTWNWSHVYGVSEERVVWDIHELQSDAEEEERKRVLQQSYAYRHEEQHKDD